MVDPRLKKDFFNLLTIYNFFLMIQNATDGSGISAATYKQLEIFTLEFAWLTENEKPVSAYRYS